MQTPQEIEAFLKKSLFKGNDMVNNPRFFKFSIILFFVLTFVAARAQEECNCKAKTEALKETWVDEKDSVRFFSSIKDLEQSKYGSCVFESLDIKFQFYARNYNTKKAYAILQKQQVLLGKMDCKEQYQNALYANYVTYYKVTNDMEKLSVYAFKALREAEKGTKVGDQISAIQGVVFLLTRMNEHQKKWAYVLRAQKLIERQEKNQQNAKNYIWLALEYETKFTRDNRLTLLDSLKLFASKAREGIFKYKMNREITNYYRVKEAYSFHKGDAKSALKNIDSAIFFAKKIEGYKNLSPLYLAKAWDHLDNRQAADASKWMDSALVLVKDIKDSSGKMMMYYDASDLYANAGNVAKAFDIYKVYSKMKDSVWNIEKVKKVNELEQKYNKVKNEKMIFELEKTKQWYTFLIICGALLLLTLVFFFRQRTLLNKQKIIEVEQRLYRARINPHFFFNALGSIQNISLEEKSNKTALFIARFAKIMRQSLESTYAELVTIESEIDFITQYLELQKLRFPDKFDYDFHLNDSLEIAELKIPGMILQPFIENAIEHGFKDIDYKGMIDITFEESEDKIGITIKDNGQGQSIEHKDKNYKSRALEIIKDRLYLFNKQNNSDAFYHVVNAKGESGFKIVVSLPKIY